MSYWLSVLNFFHQRLKGGEGTLYHLGINAVGCPQIFLTAKAFAGNDEQVVFLLDEVDEAPEEKPSEQKPAEESKNTEAPSVKEEAFQVETFKITM